MLLSAYLTIAGTLVWSKIPEFHEYFKRMNPQMSPNLVTGMTLDKQHERRNNMQYWFDCWKNHVAFPVRARFALAAVAVFVWCGIVAADNVSEVDMLPVGVELGGKSLRVACYKDGKVIDVAIPQGDAAAERFAFELVVTPEDVAMIKGALASAFAEDRLHDVVLALPREILPDRKAAICAAFVENGMKVRRCIDRTTAFAFDFMVANPSFDKRLLVEDFGDAEQDVSAVNIGDGVCEVEVVCTTSANLTCPGANMIKIEGDSLGVVHGVTMYAAVLKGKFRDKLIIDVVGHDIGILDDEGTNFMTLISKDTTIPMRRFVQIPQEFLVGEKRLVWLDWQRYPREIMLDSSFCLPTSENGYEVMIDIDAEHNIALERVSKPGTEPVYKCTVNYQTGQAAFARCDEDEPKASPHPGDVDKTVKAIQGFREIEKRDDSSGSPFWGKILMWTVIGGIFGLLSSLFKKRGNAEK